QPRELSDIQCRGKQSDVRAAKREHESFVRAAHVATGFPPDVLNPPGSRRRLVLYLAFFCSGLSGLIYQVVWVRVFGNVFGNTIYSASAVVAVFMLGLGAGSYVIGAWADRRYAKRPESLLRTYGRVELVVGLIGFG